MSMYLQGRYRPQNPRKYVGDINKIVFRSSLELVAFKFCDNNPAILKWNSEGCIIPYRSPVDNRNHRYFMDLQVWTINSETNQPQVTLIEIKPRDQIKEPKRGTKKEKTFINEMMTWQVNQAKWTAAKELCERHGDSWKFVIWTEDHLVPGQDPEVREKFRIKSKIKREKEAEEKQRENRVKLLAARMKQQIQDRQETETKPNKLLP